jgi:hypothetical protein
VEGANVKTDAFDTFVASLASVEPAQAVAILSAAPALSDDQFAVMLAMVETPEEQIALCTGNLAAARRHHAHLAEIAEGVELHTRMITPSAEAVEALAFVGRLAEVTTEIEAVAALTSISAAPLYARVAALLSQARWDHDEHERHYLYLISKEPTP